jgi:glycosyltransferase involved in cell wall biosynthesis
MKIVFFSTMNGSPWGGSEELWYKTAKLALEQEHKVSIIFKYWADRENPKLVELKKLGAYVIYRDKTILIPQEPKWYTFLRHRLKMHLKLNLPIKEPLKLQTSYEELIPLDADVICFSQGATFDLAIAEKYSKWVENLTVPYHIISQFNRDFGFSLTSMQRVKAKVIFRRAKNIFFVSKNNHSFAEHQLAERIINFKITANSLNLKDLSPIAYPESNKTCFVSLGRLDVKTKGVDLQIKCFAQPQWKNRDWEYLIYGDGPDKDYFQELINFYKLEDKVKLCGFAQDIREVWEQGQILLQPSIAEGTPLTLQEAMFCGRPAVVTDIAGNTELIKESENGFVAEGPIYNALANSLERAYNQRHLWKEMGEHAFEIAKQQINPNPEVDLLNELRTLN